MPNDKRTPVLFRYERNVLGSAEGETVSAMLADLEQLTKRGVRGSVFRQVYGTGKEVDIRKLQDQLSELWWAKGTTLLLAPSTTGNKSVDARIITAGQVAERFNQKLKDPEFRAKFFKDNVLTVGPDGQSVVTPSAQMTEEDVKAWMDRGANWQFNNAQMTKAIQEIYGSTAIPITSDDLKDFETISKLAADLNVSIDGVDFSQLPQFGPTGKGGTDFSMNVSYNADVGDPLKSPYAGNVDTLRRHAQRPGGQNYEMTVEERLAENAKAASFQFFSGPRMQSAEFLRHTIVPGVIARKAQQLKQDAYAVLRIFRGFAPDSPDPFSTGDDTASGPTGNPSFEILFQTNRFLLSGIQEIDMERMALIETFGEPYLYLFGSKARVWSYSGTLFDTQGLEWLNEWRIAFQRYMKGSASTKLKARAMLAYEDVVREGVIVTSAISKSVSEPGMAQLSFQMFVLREHFIDGTPASFADLQGGEAQQTFLFSSTQKQANIDTQYSVNYEDVTPNQGKVPQGTSTLAAAIPVEDKIAAIEQQAIKYEIRKRAFDKAALVRPSGSFAMQLSSQSNAILHQAAQNVADKIEKINGIPNTQPGGSIVLPVQVGGR